MERWKLDIGYLILDIIEFNEGIWILVIGYWKLDSFRGIDLKTSSSID